MTKKELVESVEKLSLDYYRDMKLNVKNNELRIIYNAKYNTARAILAKIKQLN